MELDVVSQGRVLKTRSLNGGAPAQQDLFLHMPSQFISFSRTVFRKSGVIRIIHIIKGLGGAKSLSK